MKSQILESRVLNPGDKIKLTTEVQSNELCIFFTAVVSKDDELFPEFLKRCK